MSKNLNHFEFLRREAFARGQRDFYRAVENADPGVEPFKNNPHQNNHATDEAEEWNDGWESAKAEHRLNRPSFHVHLAS